MTQEAREKFHAVPRIIDDQLIKALENQSSDETENTTGTNLPLHLKSLTPNFSCNVCIESLDKKNRDDEKEISFTKKYLMTHRININVRQVF